MKGPLEATESRNSIELANAVAVGEKQGTHRDENDMDRMGKLQVLRVSPNELSNGLMYSQVYQRQFKFMSVFGYAAVMGNTWEFALMYAQESIATLGSAY